MKLSPNTRYAIRILFELSRLPGPVATAQLAEKTGMSLRTVENIHAVLRQSGITAGTVGSRGGLELTRSLDQVSIGELVSLFDGGVAFAVCCGEKGNECPNQTDCGVRGAWGVISRSIQEQLDAVSLQRVLQRYPAMQDEDILPL